VRAKGATSILARGNAPGSKIATSAESAPQSPAEAREGGITRGFSQFVFIRACRAEAARRRVDSWLKSEIFSETV
jgi:hypothetical protein